MDTFPRTSLLDVQIVVAERKFNTCWKCLVQFIILCSMLIPGVLIQSRNGMVLYEVLGVKLPYGKFWHIEHSGILADYFFYFVFKVKGIQLRVSCLLSRLQAQMPLLTRHRREWITKDYDNTTAHHLALLLVGLSSSVGFHSVLGLADLVL